MHESAAPNVWRTELPISDRWETDASLPTDERRMVRPIMMIQAMWTGVPNGPTSHRTPRTGR